MNKNLKKLIALGLICTSVIGGTSLASAAEINKTEPTTTELEMVVNDKGQLEFAEEGPEARYTAVITDSYVPIGSNNGWVKIKSSKPLYMRVWLHAKGDLAARLMLQIDVSAYERTYYFKNPLGNFKSGDKVKVSVTSGYGGSGTKYIDSTLSAR